MANSDSQQTSRQQSEIAYDLVLDLLRERVAAQSDRVNVLDSKATGVMTLATGLIGTALVLQAALVGLSSSHTIALNLDRLQSVLFILLIIYLCVMLPAAVAGFWLQKFSRSPEPDRLQSYAVEPKTEAQSYIVGTMTVAFANNEQIIKSKVRCLQIASIFFFCEILVLGLLIFLQTHS